MEKLNTNNKALFLRHSELVNGPGNLQYAFLHNSFQGKTGVTFDCLPERTGRGHTGVHVYAFGLQNPAWCRPRSLD